VFWMAQRCTSPAQTLPMRHATQYQVSRNCSVSIRRLDEETGRCCLGRPGGVHILRERCPGGMRLGCRFSRNRRVSIRGLDEEAASCYRESTAVYTSFAIAAHAACSPAARSAGIAEPASEVRQGNQQLLSWTSQRCTIPSR
jgi:hypothetical protein